MNDADVSKQIQQMVGFIRQEAEEKANEISVSAEEVTIPIPSSTSFLSFRYFYRSFDPLHSINLVSRLAQWLRNIMPLLHLPVCNCLCLELDRDSRCFFLAGVQHREAAVGRSREEEDQARVRAQREAS